LDQRRVAQKRFPLLLLLHVAGAGLALGYAGEAVPRVETIVLRMGQARTENRARLRPYSVTRDYQLFDDGKQTSRSEVTADINFVPPDFKEFVISKVSGMRLGERIVRQMLEHESDIAKDYGSTEMSPANYEFRFLRQEDFNGRNCYVLEMLPRRKTKMLLRGQIWVDSATYLLHRVEGEPGKAPSWWLRNARIALSYGDVGGMWLQTASESTADVRLLGRHTMLSRDLKYQTSELVAGGSVLPIGR